MANIKLPLCKSSHWQVCKLLLLFGFVKAEAEQLGNGEETEDAAAAAADCCWSTLYGLDGIKAKRKKQQQDES